MSENVLEFIQIIKGSVCCVKYFCCDFLNWTNNSAFFLFLVVLVSKPTSQIKETGEKDVFRLSDQPVKPVC